MYAEKNSSGIFTILFFIDVICCIRCGPDEKHILDIVPRGDGARNSG